MPVSSAPPWWVPDLPESPHASADLPESSHASADLPESLPLTCQSLVTPQRSTQCPFTSLLSHLPHMDLALRSLPRFHLRSTALLDCASCDASGSRSWGGGGPVMNLVATYYISCTTLQLHITYGLHLPSFTALTHSHPPLHQSHSCHQSLINPDCLTTPAPHSHTHI